MPIEPRHPLAQAVVPQAANPGVCHLTQARRRPLSFWKPPRKIRPTRFREIGRKTVRRRSETLSYSRRLCLGTLHHLQTPGAPTQKPLRQLHSRAFRHATAVKASVLFHCVRQPQTGRAVEAGNLSGKGRGAVQKNPARLRRPVREDLRRFSGRKWAGLVVLTTGERFSTHLCSGFPDY